MDALVHLSGLGNLAPKAQAKKWASFEKRWNFQLRRLYQGTDFTHLGPALLEAAGNALVEKSSVAEPSSDESLEPLTEPLPQGDEDA
jgi:hypothetical protein